MLVFTLFKLTDSLLSDNSSLWYMHSRMNFSGQHTKICVLFDSTAWYGKQSIQPLFCSLKCIS